VEDHHPPQLQQMAAFVERAGEVAAGEGPGGGGGVVAVHCKGGKGRTGAMVCAWLLYRCGECAGQTLVKRWSNTGQTPVKR
jgi:protein-tyrosine phosphatase